MRRVPCLLLLAVACTPKADPTDTSGPLPVTDVLTPTRAWVHHGHLGPGHGHGSGGGHDEVGTLPSCPSPRLVSRTGTTLETP